MKNKNVLITGATDGIGKEILLDLATRGAKITIIGRNPEKTERTIAEVKATTGNENITAVFAELSELKQVKQAADEFKKTNSSLDILINNAGTSFLSRRETSEGFEKTWSLNHLAYFLLTNELLELLLKSPHSRIINTSSHAHYSGTINFDDVEGKKNYQPLRAYAQSKLANIMFTFALARRLEGKPVSVTCFHPGLVVTNIARNDNKLLGWLVRPLFALRGGISAEAGADTGIYLATAPEVAEITGKYYYLRKITEPNKEANDIERQERLWELSEKMVAAATSAS